jgi:hypothetical protein
VLLDFRHPKVGNVEVVKTWLKDLITPWRREKKWLLISFLLLLLLVLGAILFLATSSGISWALYP